MAYSIQNRGFFVRKNKIGQFCVLVLYQFWAVLDELAACSFHKNPTKSLLLVNN